ncbi:hypothetical protein B0H13DRAFT_1941485 [Mycena leptocephala]|nr:hypothetical protein B0H13DRAFT_1941485 [Mycena leptocephala]
MSKVEVLKARQGKSGRGRPKEGREGQVDAPNLQSSVYSRPVRWSKEDSYHLTDELLTIIEGKPRYRQAFGFSKGIAGPVDTGGKKLPQIHADVAEDLFIKDKPDTKYTAEDVTALGVVVKNRVGALKTKYSHYHQKLGATGHGLVAEGKEGEIKENSDIANAWDEITKKFRWYLRMHDLMGSSPVINRSAVAHSQTRVDLGVLDRGGQAHHGPIQFDSDDDADKISNWEPSSPSGAASDKDDDDDDDNEDDDVPATPAMKAKAEASAPPLSSARGSKRKSIQDHIQDLTTHNQSQRLKLAEAKYEAKSNLEMARLQHQQREAERQRQHELQMLERQMQLEAMRRSVSGPVTGMYGAGAPAYGAPPPNSVFDPALRYD